MNGSVSREGITLDLETMHRCGIAGAYIYNAAAGIPREPADDGGPEWLDMVHRCLRRRGNAARAGSERAGLVPARRELSLHDSASVLRCKPTRTEVNQSTRR